MQIAHNVSNPCCCSTDDNDCKQLCRLKRDMTGELQVALRSSFKVSLREAGIHSPDILQEHAYEQHEVWHQL